MKMSTDKLGNEAWGVMTRLVWRPMTERGKIFHVGISGAYESPRYNKTAALNHSSYTLKAPFPTRIASVMAQEATCLLYTSPSPRDYAASRMPSSA